MSQSSKIPCIPDALHMLPIYSKTELRTVCPSCKLAEGFVTFNTPYIIFSTVHLPYIFWEGCCEEADMNNIFCEGNQGREEHRMQEWKAYSSYPGNRTGR